jgi:type II secretory pathway pseudopilin PulG
VTYKKTKYRGHLFIELMVTMTLIGFILACLTMSLSAFQRFNHYQLTRQKCTAAAQAQIENIVLTGSHIDNEIFSRLWPKVSASIEKSPGKGQWKGLQLVKVTAESHSFNNDVKIELSRYVLQKGNSK